MSRLHLPWEADMELALLATLKEKLVQAKDFGEVFNYFMDHFGQDPAFIALGERTRHPFLETVLAQVGGQLFERQVTPANLILTRLPEHQFLHGGFTLGGRFANVIYFEEIQMGLLAVVMSHSPSETRLVRFTGRPARTN